MILVAGWDNASMVIGAAPISAWIISWGTDVLLLIIWAIIEIEDLSKSFQLFALLRLGPQVLLHREELV